VLVALLVVLLLLVGCAPRADSSQLPQDSEASGVRGLSDAGDPSIRLQALRDIAGDDLQGKDGPLAKVGFDLAFLFREYQAYLLEGAAEPFTPSNALVRVSEDGFVGIEAIAAADTESLLADLTALGLEGTASFGRVVSGSLPILAIADMAALDSLQFARPSAAATK